MVITDVPFSLPFLVEFLQLGQGVHPVRQMVHLIPRDKHVVINLEPHRAFSAYLGPHSVTVLFQRTDDRRNFFSRIHENGLELQGTQTIRCDRLRSHVTQILRNPARRQAR